MVNTENLLSVLKLYCYYYLNASAFADKIGVQRSSLSHLLSGRNKPSLDFILKIVDVFPDVDLYWF
jgi:transcriptional regulator with XRE-family HTH domain